MDHKERPIPALALAVMCALTGCQPEAATDTGDRETTADTPAQHAVPVTEPAADGAKNIMLGLLLDTSNSMDGLIDQAKAQLWNIVNKLSSARCGGERPNIQVALYEYGNARLPARGLHIRQVSAFTTDMDEISRALFSLTTNGGEEYCGAVIARSVDELQWGDTEGDLRMLVIAGNEPFTQGPVDFHQACERARRKGIVVNTIYCGNHQEGIGTSWQAGALAAKGDYFSIDQNTVTMQIASPYDDELARLEREWNANIVHYGAQGMGRYSNVTLQDENATALGESSAASRRAYKMENSALTHHWDLTEVRKEALDSVIARTDRKTLPEKFRGMDKERIKDEVLLLREEKKALRARIGELNLQRERYVAQRMKATPGANQLENAILASIERLARSKGLTFPDDGETGMAH